METYPNQKTILIVKGKYDRDFLQIGNNEWKAAYRELSGAAFPLYLYFASNANGFKLMLSSSIVMKELGISESTFRRAMIKLEDCGYLSKQSSNTNTQYFFYLSPPLPSNNKDAKSGIGGSHERTHDPSLMNNEVFKNEHREYIKDIKQIEHIDPNAKSELRFQVELQKVIGMNQNATQVVNRLRKMGYSWEWLYEAILPKMKDFNVKGYGLLFTQSYREEIDNRIKQRNEVTERMAESLIDYSSPKIVKVRLKDSDRDHELLDPLKYFPAETS